MSTRWSCSIASDCASTSPRSDRMDSNPWSDVSATKRARRSFWPERDPAGRWPLLLDRGHLARSSSRAGETPAVPEQRSQSARATFALLSEAHFFGKLGARFRIVRRHHRVIRWKPPLFAIMLRRHVVLRTQVPFERLEFFTVLKADDVVWRN